MATDVQRYRLTVAQFEQIAAAGVFAENERVELIDGELVQMSPIGARHMRCLNRLVRLLVSALPDEYTVSGQNGIRLNDDTEPQPDVAVYRDREDDENYVPAAADILLLVEIADTTRLFDRNRKIPKYAGEGIAEVWLFDLVAGVVEQYTNPESGIYGQMRTVRPGDTLTATLLPDVQVPVARILG